MTTIGDDEIKALEARARATLTHPRMQLTWHDRGSEVVTSDDMRVCESFDDDARAYLAALHPDVVLRLLSRLRAAESEVARLRALAPDPIEDAINERVAAGDGVEAALRGGS